MISKIKPTYSSTLAPDKLECCHYMVNSFNFNQEILLVILHLKISTKNDYRRL